MLCPICLEVAALPGSPSPVDLDLIKQHCSIDDDDFNDQLEVYLSAAILWAEGSTHRTIFSRAHKWVLKDFPYSERNEIRLPRGKTRSVESVQYSLNGAAQTLRGPTSGSPIGSSYQEDLRGDDGAILMPPRGGSWPSPDIDVPAPVTINFTAGWLPADVPADVLHAVLFSISDAFDLRGTSDFSPAMIQLGGPRFEAREALISPYRLVRWY